MAECLFCAVIAGVEPAELVLDDEVAVGFLDHRPVFKGMCSSLLATRRDAGRPPAELAVRSSRVQRVAAAVQAVPRPMGPSSP